MQTILTRLEAKKISNATYMRAVVTRGAEQRRLVDELLAFFGGRAARRAAGQR